MASRRSANRKSRWSHRVWRGVFIIGLIAAFCAAGFIVMSPYSD